MKKTNNKSDGFDEHKLALVWKVFEDFSQGTLSITDCAKRHGLTNEDIYILRHEYPEVNEGYHEAYAKGIYERKRRVSEIVWNSLTELATPRVENEVTEQYELVNGVLRITKRTVKRKRIPPNVEAIKYLDEKYTLNESLANDNEINIEYRFNA